MVLAQLLHNGSCWIAGDRAVVEHVGVEQDIDFDANVVNVDVGVVVVVFSRLGVNSSESNGCTPSALLVSCLVGVHGCAGEGGNGASLQRVGESDFLTRLAASVRFLAHMR